MFRILVLFIISILFSCSSSTTSVSTADDNDEIKSSSSYNAKPKSSNSTDIKSIDVLEAGEYTTRDSVATYLCKFGKLPSNYVGKDEGEELYESITGNSFDKWNFNPWTTLHVMIGGDIFSNNEKLLPSGNYHEADVNYNSANRGTKRLVYSDPCTIYYTADHYESFSPLEL